MESQYLLQTQTKRSGSKLHQALSISRRTVHQSQGKCPHEH
ncbi:HTH domain-containing protein [Pseudomonas extremaustralis]|uniref:HTH domain-containing protein n=1 Tax=Pseudomonas extremaustralis TaxID=359110 RepID=A0A5C5Q5M2_9PSED|nr:HTH domain-containing protein [Pseudomonas extremaustralis]